jgi:AcrR family transcriptional regulator
VSADPPKPSHRERLLAAMTLLASSEGYAETSVADVTAQAGVSRQTFYEHFADKQDCFLAAYREASAQIVGPLLLAIDTGDWWDTPARVLHVLLAQVESNPEAAWLFFVEGLAGGPRIDVERQRTLEQFETLTEAFLDRAPAGGMTLDVPPRALLGAIRVAAIRSIASWHLRINVDPDLPELPDVLLAWIRSYAIPAGQVRWSTGPHALAPARALRGPRALSKPLLERPGRLPRGRHGLSRGVVDRNRRERIIHAAADTIQASGYADATVGDIALAAGLGKDVLYEHFADKRHLFLVAQSHGEQETFAGCARAYFSQPTWPQRVYAGLWTMTQIIAAEPALAHLRIVAPYSAGAEAIERAQRSSAMYGVFLEEGYSYKSRAEPLPRACSTAIVDAVFEILRAQIAAGHAADMPRYVPQLAYIAIAPFTGPKDAAKLIAELAETFG